MALFNFTGLGFSIKTKNSKWKNYTQELIKLFQAYIFALVYFGLFRIYLIFFFYDKLDSSTGFGDIFLSVSHGFRYDSAMAAFFLLIPFLTNMVFSPFNLWSFNVYLRKWFSGFLYITMSLAFVVTIPYFKEYDSQFDFFLFEILYDDRSAILKTIIESYNLFGHLLVFAAASIMCFYLIRQFQKLPFSLLLHYLTKPRNLYSRSLIVLITLLLTLGALRGSFRIRPATRKWSHITTDKFLNQTVMNPIKHLQYAYLDFKSINSKTGGITKLIGNDSIKKTAQEYFSTVLPAHNADDLSNYLLKTVSGSQNVLPDHIFLIIMESYDSWPLLDEYKSLNITENLKTLGRNGVLFNHFLPSGGSTIASLSTILTGIPFTGVNISRIAAKKAPFITSAPEIFKRLGYKTRLYYGGFLSWQNIGNLFLAQGIEEIYAAPVMGKKFLLAYGAWKTNKCLSLCSLIPGPIRKLLI
ncbi:MAG: sulfatase-like hydrolase/transferase [Candidatus Neomarinimicrobiota bacterium]